MQSPKICLSLTCKTLREDVELIKKYRDYIDIAELRVDHLSEEEQLSPSLGWIKHCEKTLYFQGF